jgi:hypothetical protein
MLRPHEATQRHGLRGVSCLQGLLIYRGASSILRAGSLTNFIAMVYVLYYTIGRNRYGYSRSEKRIPPL